MENKKEEKLILVVYVGVQQYNINNGNVEDLSEFIDSIRKIIDKLSIDAETLIVPTTSMLDIEIKCINPKYITEPEVIRNHRLLMDELNEYLKIELDEKKKNNRN